MLIAIPSAHIIFRLRGAYFAIATWELAEVMRLIFAQFKSLGGGTGSSLSKSIINDTFGINLAMELFFLKKDLQKTRYFIGLR